MSGIIQEIDLADLIAFTNKKNKVFQRKFLDELETILEPQSKEFLTIRKMFLDSQNNLARAIFTAIFGDSFEGQIK